MLDCLKSSLAVLSICLWVGLNDLCKDGARSLQRVLFVCIVYCLVYLFCCLHLKVAQAKEDLEDTRDALSSDENFLVDSTCNVVAILHDVVPQPGLPVGFLQFRKDIG